MKHFAFFGAATSVATALVCGPSAFAADATPAAAGDQLDIALQAIIASDYMAYGLTETDHQPWGQIKVTPTYGIFYASFLADNRKYLIDPSINSRVQVTAGITPSIGNLSFDINVARRWKFDNPDTYRWVPYITGTYKFSDQLSASLGGGYYSYDTGVAKSFWELYGSVDATPVDWLALHAEASYDPQADHDLNDYLEVIGSVKVNLPHDFSVSGQVGFEDYLTNAVTPNALPTYTWYDVGIDWQFNPHAAIGVHYQGNDLGTDLTPGTNCSAQAWSDCDSRIYAQLTINGKLSDQKK